MRKTVNRKKMALQEPPRRIWLDDESVAAVHGGGTGAPTPRHENYSLAPADGGQWVVLCNGNVMYGPTSREAAERWLYECAS